MKLVTREIGRRPTSDTLRGSTIFSGLVSLKGARWIREKPMNADRTPVYGRRSGPKPRPKECLRQRRTVHFVQPCAGDVDFGGSNPFWTDESNLRLILLESVSWKRFSRRLRAGAPAR